LLGTLGVKAWPVCLRAIETWPLKTNRCSKSQPWQEDQWYRKHRKFCGSLHSNSYSVANCGVYQSYLRQNLAVEIWKLWNGEVQIYEWNCLKWGEKLNYPRHSKKTYDSFGWVNWAFQTRCKTKRFVIRYKPYPQNLNIENRIIRHEIPFKQITANWWLIKEPT